MTSGTILAVARDGTHRFSKVLQQSIVLVVGQGVEGDAHAGATVQHLSRIKRDPSAPNLRQVHLIHAELFEELAGKGYAVSPGQLGENITTRGIDLLGLARGTRLRLGDDAVIEVTGLRNPCSQINGLADGLMEATLDRASDGALIRKCGIMAVVVRGGTVTVGQSIEREVVPLVHEPLEPV